MNAQNSPAPAEPPVVEIHQLHKHFGPLHAVDGLTLTVSPGEVVAFLGPNGAGKSTTLDILMGFSEPTSGSVRILGTTPSQAVSQGRLGAVLQMGGLSDSYTVAQTLRIIASLQCRRPDVEDIVAQTNLEGILRRKVSKCSGGEIQRLRLALALMPQPDLLILDEPTTGLDPSARAAFWETMRRYSTTGRSILFATHYLQEASDFADRIIIISQGRLVACGSVDEIRSLGEGTTVTATWPGITGTEELKRALEPLSSRLLDVQVHGSHVQVRTTASDDVARLLMTTTPARHLGVSALSLDEIFSELVTEDADESAARAS